MMDDKVKKEIEAVVASIFSEKEDEIARKRTEDALSASANTIDDLTSTLEEKNVEVEGLETKISEAGETITDLESKLEAAKTENESVTEQLNESNQKMEDMLKDKAADERMTALEEAGVARTDKESQRTKVREMSDEEFASYKEELEAIREAVLSELKVTKEEEAKEEEATKEAKEEEATEEVAEEAEASEGSKEEETSEEEASEETEEEEEVETAPAHIDPGQALSAALNFEVYPSEDLKRKYGALGDAMAEAFKNKDEL